MSTTVTYKGSTLTTVDNQTRTLTTAGKYLEDNITLTDVTSGGTPTLQNKTVTPTESQQTVQADSGYDGLDTVTVNAMPSGSATVPNSITGSSATVSSTQGKLTLGKLINVTPTVSAGYISAGTAANVNVSLVADATMTGAGTIYTSTSDQIISAGTYLNGNQTIKAVTTNNLTAENIKQGVTVTVGDVGNASRIASVTGTYSGGGGGGDDVVDKIIDRTISGSYTNSTATAIGSYAFYSCSSLETVNFPNATKISSYAFCSCGKLISADFPNVTSVSTYAFYSCSRLLSVSLPKATSIYNYAFYGCSSLETAVLPSAIIINSSAFMNCRNLSMVSLLNASSIGANAFRGCSKLMSVYVLRSSVVGLGASAFTSTPLSNSTYTGAFGSIYVPASLVSTYASRANWSLYSARITSYNG